MCNKIPVEILLKYSRQEVGELKSYIQELEYNNNKLSQELKNIHNANKQAKVEARKEQLYNNLRSQVSALQSSNTEYRKKYKEIVCELVKYREKYGTI